MSFADVVAAPPAGRIEASCTGCAHCGQPVLRPDAAAVEQFCCSGCASVHALLLECGLDDYYRLRARADGTFAPAKPSNRRYAELDQPEFRALHCHRLEGGRLGTELFLENVHCAACVWLVEKASSAVT